MKAPLPECPNGATVAGGAFLLAVKGLQAVGRDADAQRYLEASARLGQRDRNTPNIGAGGRDTNLNDTGGAASGVAMIELAKADVAARCYRSAIDKLGQAGQTPLTREQRREINNLILQIKDKAFEPGAR